MKYNLKWFKENAYLDTNQYKYLSHVIEELEQRKHKQRLATPPIDKPLIEIDEVLGDTE